MKNISVVLLAACILFASLISCENESKEPPVVPEGTSTWDGTTFDTNWYKTGESNFTLTEASQLAGLSQLVNRGTDFTGKTITLGVNVDLQEKPWTPIGTQDHKFAGTFDGGGNTISKLTINEGGYIGLFGVVGNATIKNINLANAHVSGTKRVGALIGKIAGKTTITNVTVDENSSVTGTESNTGGIIGSAEGTFDVILKNLTNNAKVTNSQASTARAAGIIAQATSGVNVSIEDCVNNGAIEATEGYPGGILSALQGSSDVVFTNCKNTGTLTGKYKGHMIAWLCNGARVTIKEYAEGIHDDVIGAIFLGGSDDYFYHIWINGTEIFVNKLSVVPTNTLELANGANSFNILYKDRGELSKKALDRAIGFYTYIKKKRPTWNIDYTSYWKIFEAYSTFGGDGWPQCLTEYNNTLENPSDHVSQEELKAIGEQRRAKNLITLGK